MGLGFGAAAVVSIPMHAPTIMKSPFQSWIQSWIYEKSTIGRTCGAARVTKSSERGGVHFLFALAFCAFLSIARGLGSKANISLNTLCVQETPRTANARCKFGRLISHGGGGQILFRRLNCTQILRMPQITFGGFGAKNMLSSSSTVLFSQLFLQTAPVFCSA